MSLVGPRDAGEERFCRRCHEYSPLLVDRRAIFLQPITCVSRSFAGPFPRLVVHEPKASFWVSATIKPSFVDPPSATRLPV